MAASAAWPRILPAIRPTCRWRGNVRVAPAIGDPRSPLAAFPATNKMRTRSPQGPPPSPPHVHNLYSHTKGPQAVRDAARAIRDTTSNLPRLLGIFSDHPAPIVRNAQTAAPPDGRSRPRSDRQCRELAGGVDGCERRITTTLAGSLSTRADGASCRQATARAQPPYSSPRPFFAATFQNEPSRR